MSRVHVCKSKEIGKEYGLSHGVCGYCKVCFESPNTVVGYPMHGRRVNRPHIKRDNGGTHTQTVVVSVVKAGDFATVTVRRGEVSDSTTVDLRPVPLHTKTLAGIKVPGSKVQLFSKPSKMQTDRAGKLKQIYCFGTTAFYSPAAQVKTCPLATMKNCGSYCYARQGHFGFINSLLASEVRTLWLHHHLEAGNLEYLTQEFSKAVSG